MCSHASKIFFFFFLIGSDWSWERIYWWWQSYVWSLCAGGRPPWSCVSFPLIGCSGKRSEPRCPWQQRRTHRYLAHAHSGAFVWHIYRAVSMSLGFPGGSDCKECTYNRRSGFDPWVRKLPWRRAGQPTPVFFSEESQGQRNLVGYSPWGHRVGHDWASNTVLWARHTAGL